MKKSVTAIFVFVIASIFATVYGQDEDLSAYGYVYSEELKVAYISTLLFADKDDCLDTRANSLLYLWDDYVNDDLLNLSTDYTLAGYEGTVVGWGDPEEIRNDYNELIAEFKRDGYIVKKVSFYFEPKPCS